MIERAGGARFTQYLIHAKSLLHTRSFGPQSFSPQGSPGAGHPHIHSTEEEKESNLERTQNGANITQLTKRCRWQLGGDGSVGNTVLAV